jgi:hypothetical protein
MSPAARTLRPYITRQWKALAGAGGGTVVLTLADLAKPWPLALIVDRLLNRQAPFELTSSDCRDRAGDRGRRGGVAVLLRLLAAERRRAHHARAADRRL